VATTLHAKQAICLSAIALFCVARAANGQDLSYILGSWNVVNTLSGIEWGTKRGSTWSDNVQFARSGSGAIGTFPSDRREIKTDGRAAWLTCPYCVCADDRDAQPAELVWSADRRSFSFTYTTHSNECDGPARRTTATFSR
jgi:hypothetical protein